MFTQGDRSIRKGTLDGRLIEKACLGSNDLFYIPWLRSSTVETILTKFGQTDGPLVIEATNDYLDNLEYTKANNLATFINEDPMMVCSLGLQPQLTVLPSMPIRKLVGNGTSYIDTGIDATTALLSFDCLADIKGMSGYPATLFGVIYSYTGGTGMYGFINHGIGGNGFRYGMYNTNYVASGVPNNTNNVHLEGIVTASSIELKVNGVSKGTASKGNPSRKSIYMFRANCSEPGRVNSNIAHLRLYTPSGDVGWFVPFIRSGVVECLDIVAGAIATRSGSFTIEYTLPDGTPWTPSTP